MARVKLKMPGKILSTITVPVRITDLNYGNHVGNDSFVSILHEARVQWLHQHEFTELAAGGVSLIMADLQMEYKKESHYADVLSISIAAGEISSSGFELYYLAKNQNDELVLIAKTGMVCYDYAAKKVVRITDKLKSILE